jgi:hypothetical protein
MNMRLVPFMILLSLLMACATYPNGDLLMVQGKMLSVKDGSVMHLEIENYATGQLMTGANQTTGERFKGNYAIVNEGSSSTGVVTNSFGFTTGQINTNSSKLILKGMLKGDRGTIIDVTVYLGPSVVKYTSPGTWNQDRFYGEATDNFGTKYQIFMSGEVVARAIER